MFERCIYFNTNALVRKINSHWDKAFKELGFPPSYAYLMRLVLETPGITSSELSTQLQLDKSTVTRFVDKLVKNDWLIRAESENDQREKRIKPTDKAQTMADQFQDLGDELYEQMCAALGRENLARFVKQLRDINKVMCELN